MDYKVIVIGSGPGGYVAAIRSAQLGMKTAIIEKYDTLGGTCLNVGCIPSKALLDSSEHYHNAGHRFKEHGIGVGSLKLNMKQMIARKNVAVKAEDGKETKITGDYIIIATGSKPITPPAFNYDKNRVISSTEALNIDKLPKKMVVIGGGVIGLELGSVFARLGTEVEVVEFQDRILAEMDKDCSKELMRSMKKLGVKFHLKHKVTGTKPTKTSVTVNVQKRDSEETFDIKADYCLVAIGRYAYTDKLGLENVGVVTDDRGRVEVDSHLKTNVDNIFAIGDVVKGAMLAHKAEEEGVFVVEYIAGEKPHIDYNLIPGVVYTWPEVSSVGKTEEQLKEAGVKYKSGKFPMKALGRARASMDIEGMVKVLADAETDELLGVHMVGPRVADVIMEAVALMEFRASAEDMARICHPHPTYTEAVKEAALAATGNRPLHI